MTQHTPRQPEGMGPVKAVQTLHRLIKSSARPQDQKRLMAAVSMLAAPKRRITKVETVAEFTRNVLAKAEGLGRSQLAQKVEEMTRRHAQETAQLRAEIQRLGTTAEPLRRQPVMRIKGGRRTTEADAADYLAKAADTPDPTLRRGYTALANNLNDRN